MVPETYKSPWTIKTSVLSLYSKLVINHMQNHNSLEIISYRRGELGYASWYKIMFHCKFRIILIQVLSRNFHSCLTDKMIFSGEGWEESNYVSLKMSVFVVLQQASFINLWKFIEPVLILHNVVSMFSLSYFL